MARQNTVSKGSKIIKCYVDDEQFRKIFDESEKLGIGMSDILKISWCHFSRDRESKPQTQTQASRQSNRNEQIRLKAIEESKKDIVETPSLAIAEELTKFHGFKCLTVREGVPEKGTKKLWILQSPFFKQSDIGKEKNQRDLIPIEGEEEMFEELER